MSKIKQLLNEDFNVLTGQELDYPSDMDYLANELENTALKIAELAKIDSLTGYENDLRKTIELLTLVLDVHELKTKVDSQKVPF